MVRLEQADQTHNGVTTLTLYPNRSISITGLLWCFTVISVVALAAATYFALQGLWVPLPFAGLELTALGYCLYRVRVRDLRAERIQIDADAVCVERRDRSGDARWRFKTGWTRVRLAAGGHRWYPRRLLIGQHGNEIEVGAFLNEQERKSAATELRHALAPVSALVS
jgi:uncharacterized membrane protein